MDNFNAAEAARRLMALEAAQGAAGVPGMPGTPGGPVQESPTMTAERLAQPFLLGLGGGPYGGYKGFQNATEPNIRDVWADQLRMKMQGN